MEGVARTITSENYDQYQKDAIQTLASYVQKQRLALPQGEIKFYRTVDPVLTGTLDILSKRIRTKLNQLIANVDLPGCEQLGRVTDAKEVDIWYKDIITLNDSLLDGANISLDEFTGRNRKFAASSATQLAPTIGKVQSKSGPVNVVYSRVIGRPQIKFKNKVDNSGAPFVPKLSYKPNGIVPFKEGSSHSHPYQYEITNIKYPSFIFEKNPPINYPSIETTPFTWVDTLEELSAVCQKLEASREFAVDLEHHDYRSYQGFTCLIQISTRDEDFIIDALELRDSLHTLNNAFTNPNILKVFHGADYDIQWLQKDFGVYVVNMFDTGAASYILVTLDRSAEVSLKVYETFGYDKTGKGPGGYQRLLDKWRATLDRQQFAVFRSLHEWRDTIARLEDESIKYYSVVYNIYS
ncbi:9019_t:CDS:2 [Acaulospora colombiana]|uniref:9019_t:CDS:1 n=1 Tax=Acaulospora colombiana TaxID=27376 RepID=A0ACA9JZS2_9GLOM|nr:9019_t:CDS:2 [Acaulospora colombiana]